ncbi:hypothetical protein ACHAWT_008594 [Skeletonema menzelii]
MKPRHHTTDFVLKSIVGTLGGIKSGTDGSPSKNNDLGGITTASKQLHATQHLFEISSRLGTCETIIDGIDEELEQLEGQLPSDLARRLTRQKRIIKEVITPMITASKASTEAAAAKLSPIPAVKRYNEQQETLRRKAVSGCKNPEQQMVKNFLKEQASSTTGKRNTPVVSPAKKSPPKRTRTNKHKTQSGLSDLLPRPQYGAVYTLGEAVNYASKLLGDDRAKSNTGKPPSKSKVFNAMVDEKYFQQSNRSTFFRHLEKLQTGDEIPLDLQLSSGGRPPIMTPEEVNAVVDEQLSKISGHSFNKDDIAKAIADAEKEKKLKQGFVPKEREIGRTTIDNYRVQFASHPNVSLTQNAVIKSSNRATAESSIRAVLSLLAVIASGHFVPIDEECPDIKRQLRDADDKCRLLYDMVEEALGGVAVFPVKPEYIFSTDDTTCYIFEGKVDGKDKWTLVTNDSIRNSGTSSVYRVEDTKMMNGMRVKLTFTFSAAGMCAPLFVTVSGLSEEEMPNKPFLHMKVPGLCIGGGGVTVGNECEGHVFFMRKMEGADRTRYEYYQREVLIPFINGVRKELDDFDASAGTSIPKELTAVSWCDGDLAQIATIVSDIERLTENLIHALKQNAARSAREQAADLARVFNNLKKYIETFSAKDSAGATMMHQKIAKAMETLEKTGDLKMSKPNHKKALLDFLAILPMAATKAATVDNIQHGFIQNGMIDRETKRFPVLANILGTCTRDVLIKELKMLLEAFPDLLDNVNKYGRIPEAVFDHYQFARDKTPSGEEYIRPDSIRQTHMRRAEFLTSPYQAGLRLEDIKARKMAVKAKREKENMRHQQHIDANAAIVKKLCDMVRKEADESNLRVCQKRHFANLTSPELKAFIRYHDDSIRYVKDIPTTKGSIEEADRGLRNRILVAWQCRDKPSLLDGDMPHNLEEEGDDGKEAIQLDDIVMVHTVNNHDDNAMSPSELLGNQSWVDSAVKLFCLDEYMQSCFKSDANLDDGLMKYKAELQKKADVLVKMLRQRLKEHIKTRAISRRDHWVWNLARKNLSVVAAYMILAGHTKPRIACIKEDGALLFPDTNKFAPCAMHPKHEGCYLFYDYNECVFIRSGKVTGGGVESRLKQHKSAAEAEIASSRFYDQYPSEKTVRSEKRDKRGFFEDLHPVLAAGFCPDCDVAKSVCEDVKDGGILLLSEHEKASITSYKLDEKMTDIEKFRAILAYQFELGYDLAIASRDNVSQSPCFESFIGIFGGGAE